MKRMKTSKFQQYLDLPPEAPVRIYSWQDMPFIQEMEKQNPYYANPDLIDKDFLSAYKWLFQYLPGYEYPKLPIWVWLRRPNIKQMNEQQRQGYLITAIVPRSRCLFSEFNYWHGPLNNHHLDFYTARNSDPDIIDDFTQQEITNSWQGILRPNPREKWCTVQCCVNGLYKHEIVQVREFTRERKDGKPFIRF